MKLSWARVSAATLVAMGAVLAWSAPARAQTGGIGGTTTIANLAAEDFFIGVQAVPGENLTDFDLLTYFNQANCQCKRETSVFVALNATGVAKRPYITRGVFQLWVGSGCDAQATRDLGVQCERFDDGRLVELAAAGGQRFTTTAEFLSKARGTAGVGTTGTGGASGTAGTGGVPTGGDPCTAAQQVSTQNVYVIVDQDENGVYDVFAVRAIPIDLAPPPAPTAVTVQGGNEALVAKWTAVDPIADASGILGYQVLCNRADQFQVFPTGSFKPGYQTAATNCADRLPGGGTVESLDPAFICSEVLSATATSARIKILQNGIFYGVSVAAIDKHMNASISPAIFEKPLASRNFYNEYRNADPSNPGEIPAGGKDAGGFCSVDPGTTIRFSGPVALGAAALAIAVLRRRRRRGQ